jgi:hypothetical protein
VLLSCAWRITNRPGRKPNEQAWFKLFPFEFLSSRLGTPDAAGRCLFSQLPPGFPVVPQYLGHTSVVPQPLTEPDKRLSHIRLFTQTFSFGLNGFMCAFALPPIRVRFVATVCSRLESCLCFFFHGRSSAGPFTPRGLAASSLHQVPSRYKDPF